MKITILAVGKKPRGWVADAMADYATRLAPHAVLEFRLVSPQDENILGTQKAQELECAALLEKISAGAELLACDPAGELVDSPRLAAFVGTARDVSRDLVFIIGGSHGLSDELRKRADRIISFGRVTLPHELFRVLLTEQIYRSFQILAGSKYHK